MKKQTVQQIITLILSLALVYAAYSYITVDGSVFKGEMQGEPSRAKGIRVTDTKNSNITGENGMDSIY
ncbi:MAG: hypothetical protein IKR90_06630, partial [Clostridia bacterium]|nr:hypothetical protein [Clostridia bacterium]